MISVQNLSDIVSDISLNVIPDIRADIIIYRPALLQIKIINDAIASSKDGSPLYKRAMVEDPCENMIRAHVATLEWHMLSRKFGMPASELVRLQEKSVEVLESVLESHFLTRTVCRTHGNLRRRTAFCTRCVSLSSSDGPRISAPKDLNTVILILSRRLRTAPTIRRFSWPFCDTMSVRATSSTCWNCGQTSWGAKMTTTKMPLSPWSGLREKKGNQQRTTLFLVTLAFAIRCCSRYMLAARTTRPCRHDYIIPDILYDIVSDITYDIYCDIGSNIGTDISPDKIQFTHTVFYGRPSDDAVGASRTSLSICWSQPDFCLIRILLFRRLWKTMLSRTMIPLQGRTTLPTHTALHTQSCDGFQPSWRSG